MRLPSLPFALAAVVLVLATGTTRADLVGFSYAWSVTPGSIKADEPRLGFMDILPGGSGTTTGGQGFVGPVLTFSPSVTTAGPVTFTDDPITLTLRLTDGPSGLSDVLTFRANLSATLAGSSAEYHYGFIGNAPDVILGGDRYFVIVGQDPLPWSPTVSGLIFASAITPEPSSLLLAGLAVPALGLLLRRRRHSVSE
jgi:hypothetical protein